jgi:hypothetical protein
MGKICMEGGNKRTHSASTQKPPIHPSTHPTHPPKYSPIPQPTHSVVYIYTLGSKTGYPRLTLSSICLGDVLRIQFKHRNKNKTKTQNNELKNQDLTCLRGVLRIPNCCMTWSTSSASTTTLDNYSLLHLTTTLYYLGSFTTVV